MRHPQAAVPSIEERIARQHWDACLFINGKRISGIACWDGLSHNARQEVLAQVEAMLNAIEAAGMAVVEMEDGR
jgi:hypothetical protein